MEVLALDLLFELPLAVNRQNVVLYADEDVFFLQAGQFCLYDNLLFGFIDVARRNPLCERQALFGKRRERKIEKTIEPVLKQIEGVRCHHITEALDWSQR